MLRPITQADTVLAVYHECHGRVWYEPRIIFAAWPDGHVVWSRDRWKGGPPYYANDLDPSTFTTALMHFEQNGLFASARLARYFNVAPDYSYTVILLRLGAKELKMSSCHEFEEGGTTAATGQAPVPLKGHTRVDALAREPAGYLLFRLMWGETRRALEHLLPETGALIAGDAVADAGELFWQEP